MLKAGVIGVGHLGRNHARVYHELPNCELAGILDIDKDKAREISAKYSAKSFDSLDDLLDACDAVSIVTPTTSHFEIGMRALETGVHILAEKPMTTTVEQAERLLEYAGKKELTLQVGHIERFNPAFTSVRDSIKDPLFIETHRLSGFGGRGIEVDVILDLMIHDIDLILTLAGEEPSEIRCAGAPVLTSTSDIANVRLEFPSGCTANVTASRISTNPMRKMRIFQKAGYISIDFAERKSEVYLLTSDAEANPDMIPVFSVPFGGEGKSIRAYYPEVKQADMLEAEIKDFISSIETGNAPIVDGRAGLRALKVANQIIEKLPRIPEDIIAGS
ncbi:MAG: gfo/Idh/MocA family oxidoreductase [candidate division Zixibacteria bacterium]|nr:gfo/Idh/MocA family oxidoreductase [candidate division Zixibacteria bacterium]